ncbi:MAG: hypothetical protein ACLFWD_08005 [Anaerolineales bacterium]
MIFLQLTLWLGITAIYLGFAGTFGLLLRKVSRRDRPLHHWLAILHGGLILLPSTILVLGFDAWPLALSLMLVLAGAGIAYLGARQPGWTPVQLWNPTFGQRYFAVSMALAALWALAFAWQRPALAPAILAAAALAASLASLTKSPQSL